MLLIASFSFGLYQKQQKIEMSRRSLSSVGISNNVILKPRLTRSEGGRKLPKGEFHKKNKETNRVSTNWIYLVYI